MYVPRGLESDYESKIVHLTSPTYPLSQPDAQFALQSQEMRIEAQNSVNVSDPFATLMENLPFRCGHGGNGGRNNSHKRGREERSSGHDNGRPTCKLCDRVGHLRASAFNALI